MTVGNKIRVLRLHNNWTQKYLAQVIGVSELTIRNYECGKSRVRGWHLDKLSEVFGIDKSVLMDNHDKNVNDVMQTLFFLRDEFGLRVASVEDVPTDKNRAVFYFEDRTLSQLVEAWKDVQKGLDEEKSVIDLLVAWELLFPKSYAKDCAVKLDMHRKRGKIACDDDSAVTR